jgi:phosphate transport system substrate-binding protein
MRILTLALVLTMAFVSCKKTRQAYDTLTGGLIFISASDEFEPLIDAEIDAFCAHFDSAHVFPTYRTEKEAIRLLVEDSVRFTIATRDLTERERLEMERNNLSAHRSLIAFDGIALVTNPSNRDSIISLPALKKILTGEITDWSQISPDNRAGTIRILFDNQQSGVFRYMVDTLLGRKIDRVSPNLYELGTTVKVLKRTSELPGALGLIAFSHVSGRRTADNSGTIGNVRLMRVSREDVATPANSYLPFAGDIKSGKYPLWRPVYILVSDPRSGLPTGFAVFIANQVGQKVIQKAGLLPVTDTHNIPIEIIDGFD